jgi:hypothetical protein
LSDGNAALTDRELAEIIESHAQAILDETVTIRHAPEPQEAAWERIRADVHALRCFIQSTNRGRR